MSQKMSIYQGFKNVYSSPAEIEVNEILEVSASTSYSFLNYY